VQLPVIKGQHEDERAEMHEFQTIACRETKDCELAVVLEFGQFDKLHPPYKEGVGTRPSLLARGTVYGEDIVCRGPVFRSQRIEGNRVILEFDSIGGGLVARGKVRDFIICDASGEFVPAQARIVGQTVEVSADRIAAPVAVCYGWKNFFAPSSGRPARWAVPQSGRRVARGTTRSLGYRRVG
jgi:sialate O-acetylesterase